MGLTYLTTKQCNYRHATRCRWIRILAPVVFLVLLVGACGPPQVSDDPEKLATEINTAKQQASVMLDDGDYESAMKTLEPLAKRSVKDEQVYTMLAGAQWKLGQYDDAIKNYEEAMRLDYTDVVTHVELAQLLMEMGKTGRALTEFELAVQYGDRDPLPYYNYGLALFDLGRKKDALVQWESAYALDKTNPIYAEAMGIGLSGDDDEAALPYFELADTLGADTPAFHNNYGLLLQRLEHFSRAEYEFKRAMELEPDDLSVRSNLALLYMVSGQYAIAVPLWEELLGGAGQDPAYRVYLARAYLETERYAEAIDLLGDWLVRVEGNPGLAENPLPARLLDPPDIDVAYDVLAMAQRGVGDLNPAVENIRKALKIKPDSVVHLINYGVILAESGKIADAKSQWRRVLELDPGNVVAEQNLSAFER
jgi:superkiller protein 3